MTVAEGFLEDLDAIDDTDGLAARNQADKGDWEFNLGDQQRQKGIDSGDPNSEWFQGAMNRYRDAIIHYNVAKTFFTDGEPALNALAAEVFLEIMDL